MRINNELERILFEKAVRNCRRSVKVVTCTGKSFDLKTRTGFAEGIAELQKSWKSWQEPELFTNSGEDSTIMLHFFDTCPAAR